MPNKRYPRDDCPGTENRPLKAARPKIKIHDDDEKIVQLYPPERMEIDLPFFDYEVGSKGVSPCLK